MHGVYARRRWTPLFLFSTEILYLAITLGSITKKINIISVNFSSSLSHDNVISIIDTSRFWLLTSLPTDKNYTNTVPSTTAESSQRPTTSTISRLTVLYLQTILLQINFFQRAETLFNLPKCMPDCLHSHKNRNFTEFRTFQRREVTLDKKSRPWNTHYISYIHLSFLSRTTSKTNKGKNTGLVNGSL